MAVYQEKNKNKIPKDGRCWYYRCYYTDMYGNRKQKQSKFFQTKKEASEEERMFLVKIETNSIVKTNGNLLFKDVYKEYLEYKKRTLKITTFYALEKRLDKHILSYFDKYKLNSIKINIINDFINNLETKDLTLKYQNSIIGYLKEILIYGVENYDFDRKVANKVIKHRIDTPKKVKNDAEWNYWNYDEFNSFISIVDNDFYYLMFWLIYYTGLRLGEMLSLTWNKVDLENRIIKIEDNYTNKLGIGTHKIITPKTDNSVRIVDIDDKTLLKLKKYYEEEKKLYSFNEDMFVFGNIKPISPTTFARYLDYYIEKANIKRITPHGFRHSHVSLLIYLGCDSRDVAERVGDTVQTIEKTYYHMFPKKKAQTICALNELNSRN